MPKANFFYLWNPFIPAVLEKLTDKMHQLQQAGHTFSVLTHAAFRPDNEWTSRHLLSLPWLKQNTTHSNKVLYVDMPPIGKWRPMIFDTVPIQQKEGL